MTTTLTGATGLVLSSAVLLAASTVSAEDCVPSETRLCLLEGRFSAELAWQDVPSAGFVPPEVQASGVARAHQLSDDTGAFGLVSAEDASVVVKVLDGTPINRHYWVFAAGATDLGLTLTITDTETARQVVYSSRTGDPFPTVTDTSAFESTGKMASGQTLFDTPKSSSCPESVLCLAEGDVQVRVRWRDPFNQEGEGSAVPFSDGSGFLWFFTPSNLEMVVNVIDGRSVNGSYWFAAAATTNVALTIDVLDAATGRTATYHSEQGEFTTIIDKDPFGLAPESPLIVPLGAARASGREGSQWHDRQLLMGGDRPTTFSLVVTPRSQAYDPEADPRLEVTLGPGETLVIEDLYERLFAEEGTGTVRLLTAHGDPPPMWRSVVYHRSTTGESGMQAEPFHAGPQGWFGGGVVLAAMLSPAGFRDNLDITTGPIGLTGTWVVRSPTGEVIGTREIYYPPMTTVQHSASAILGTEPGPSASLRFEVRGGQGRIFLSRNENITNDPVRDELRPLSR